MRHSLSFACVLLGLLGAVLAAPLPGDDPPAVKAAGDSKAEVRRLVEVLGSSASTYDKTIACKELAHRGDAGSVPAIARLLDVPELNHPARIALENIPAAAAGEALIAALDTTKGLALVGVINSLGARRETAAAKVLTAKLSDKDPAVAKAAALALGKIANEDALKALQAAWASAQDASAVAVGDGLLRCAEALVAQGNTKQALAVYAELQKPAVDKSLRVAAARASTFLKFRDGSAAVNERLFDPDPALFAVALEASAAIPSAEMTRALVDALPKLAPPRQVVVLAALKSRCDRSALPKVIELANSKDDAVATAAFEAFATLGDTAAIPLLVEGLNSGKTPRVTAAYDALCTLQSSSADQAVADALQKAQGDSFRALIELAGERRLVKAVPVLIRAMDDNDAAIRKTAITSLGKSATIADLSVLIERLVKPRDSDELLAVQTALRVAFERLADKEACVKILAETVKDARPETEQFACELMALAGTSAAAAFVGTAAASNGDENVRETASRVLGEWPNTEAAPVLLELAKTSPTGKLRTRALRGYLRIIRQFDSPTPRRLDMIEEVMKVAERNEERIMAVEAIGRIPNAEALAAALTYLDKPLYRETACAAAVQIAEELVPVEPAKVVDAMQKVLPAIEDKKVALRAESALQEARKRLDQNPGHRP